MEKVIETIKLMAKAGLFFANCDGHFEQRERHFINAFLEGILEVGEISDSLKEDVRDTLNHSYTIDGIIADTEHLIEGFNEDERKAILFTISQFILKVVASDSKEESAERENYIKWKEAFGI